MEILMAKMCRGGGGDGHRLSWGMEGAMAKLAGLRGMDRFFKRECDHGTE